MVVRGSQSSVGRSQLSVRSCQFTVIGSRFAGNCQPGTVNSFNVTLYRYSAPSEPLVTDFLRVWGAISSREMKKSKSKDQNGGILMSIGMTSAILHFDV
jgi:hypothetical protein